MHDHFEHVWARGRLSSFQQGNEPEIIDLLLVSSCVKAVLHEPKFHPSVTNDTHSFLFSARERQLFLP